MSRNSLSGPRWEAVCQVVKDRDGWACVECGTEQDLTVDHIEPLNLFTVDDWDNERQFDPDNLATLCRPCNGRKSDKKRIRVTWFNRRWLDTVAPAPAVF